jgi:hypothetical protein
LIRLDAKAGLETAFGGGQGIVKIRGICEIAHAKTVQPIQRTELALISDDQFNGEFPRVHETEYNVGARAVSNAAIFGWAIPDAICETQRNLRRDRLANYRARAIHFYIEIIERCLWVAVRVLAGAFGEARRRERQNFQEA